MTFVEVADPQASLNTNTLETDLGSVSVGRFVERTFIVTNKGSQTATAIQARVGGHANDFQFKDGVYPGSGGSCGTTVQAGEHCNLVIIFLPASEGKYSGMVQILYVDRDNNLELSRTLLGTGVPLTQATATVQPSSSPAPQPSTTDPSSSTTGSTSTSSSSTTTGETQPTPSPTPTSTSSGTSSTSSDTDDGDADDGSGKKNTKEKKEKKCKAKGEKNNCSKQKD